jgi:hypothetical protein
MFKRIKTLDSSLAKEYAYLIDEVKDRASAGKERQHNLQWGE